ncbi:MAG: ABC transporter ATP-binding protein [Ruminococcaceae bacterium]|nr:ABC transporter ATP-binding protein [Oscillospiraceae bacterium]
MNTKKQTFKRLFEIIGKYKPMLILTILLALVFVVISLYIPILIGDAIDTIIGADNVNFELLTPILVRIATIVLLGGISQWIMSIINNYITYNTVRDIRELAFKKLMKLPIKYIDSNAHGGIVSRVITDVDTFADGLLMGFTQVFTGVATIVGTLVFMLSMNPLITVAVIILTPLSLFAAKFISSKTYSLFKLQSEKRAEQTALTEEMITNVKTVKAFNFEDKAITNFGDINNSLSKVSLKAVFYSSLTNPVTRFVNSMVYMVVALIGAVFVINGGLTVGMLVSFLSYANQYTKPFNEISGVITELQNAIACLNRVFDLIYEEERSCDGSEHFTNNNGTVEFKNVYFSYSPDKPLIEDFSLKVNPGETIAIVGPTGCGKTTLINILMRFYDVQSGQIIINGKNIKDISRDELRSSFGMVLQETWLKSGTVFENLKMGLPEATEEQIIEAAKLTRAHSFIKRLPNGYNTVIGESGGSLSEGQKQLLCITRVMAMNPPMLILDEATSSIDTRTELKISKAFDLLMKNKTSFVVAHRLSTIKDADRILVMKDGNVIEIGTHSELINQKGFYYSLYKSQFDF